MSMIIMKDGTQIYYKGAPHGITYTHKKQLNDDLLEFLKI